MSRGGDRTKCLSSQLPALETGKLSLKRTDRSSFRVDDIYRGDHFKKNEANCGKISRKCNFLAKLNIPQ